jgi:hypothetical protein
VTLLLWEEYRASKGYADSRWRELYSQLGSAAVTDHAAWPGNPIARHRIVG